MPITTIILPEIVVASVACVLILMGISHNPAVRRASAGLALATLLGVFVWLLAFAEAPNNTLTDPTAAVRLNSLGYFVKVLAAGIGVLLVLVNWPTNRDGSGNLALNYGTDAGEFFGLMLLSISGLMLVASANDIMLLFLAVELASLPAYVMVSISRPLPMAQEAGVKYFFLGAMAAAILLLGLAYLYGATGLTSLYEIATLFRSQAPAEGSDIRPILTPWQTLAIVIVIAGLLFKLAAAPFHTYVGDVYEGAATPVTAFLGFVPKTSGLVAILKILFVASGGTWNTPDTLFQLMWWIAVLTMTLGNVLGLIQRHSIKRALAYSSVAHSGYLLVGVVGILATGGQPAAVQATLFYLVAYALMNTGAFAVLTALPAHEEVRPGFSAETYDDVAGAGRRHLWLGLAMAICCFSLIGLPLTVGFFGKLMIVQPALAAGLWSLVVITVINAGISSGYYLRIIAAIFLRHDPTHGHPASPGYHPTAHHPIATTYRAPLPISLAVGIATAGVILFGTVLPATQVLSNRTTAASVLDIPTSAGASEDDAATPATAPAESEVAEPAAAVGQ